VEIINKMLPKASLFDFLSCGSFHKASLDSRPIGDRRIRKNSPMLRIDRGGDRRL